MIVDTSSDAFMQMRGWSRQLTDPIGFAIHILADNPSANDRKQTRKRCPCRPLRGHWTADKPAFNYRPNHLITARWRNSDWSATDRIGQS
ncbi:unnamed protein product [Nezara viridula]|uniref:Uncharacterized protein n=1 Tax=Nezara viridula TaxID=85310 RepID=A0A9P0MS92_NEZVI|nr:unnamed protein product [Nezara viridula]